MADLVKTEAIVLNALRWQESSKIVHLYTRDLGYIKVIAKGALRPKSSFRGVLETLNHTEVIFSQKSSRSLQILTSVSLLHAYLPIRENLEKTGIAFAALEVLSALFSVHEPVENFFDYLTVLLVNLEKSRKADLQPFLWHLLFRVADFLGFSWNIDYCLSCKNGIQAAPVSADAANGGFLCGNCRPVPQGNQPVLDLQTWQTLRSLLREAHPADENLPAATISWLTPTFLRHLSLHADTALELKSLKWYV